MRLRIFSSEPPSQYCRVMKYARTSCAVPGMKRSIWGMRRSIFIWAAPPVEAFSLLPLSFLSKAMGPLAGLPMSKWPSLVSFTTSLADIKQIIASQDSRRARSAPSTGKKWSSRNSIPATTMSACAISALQRAIAASFPANSDAACIANSSPGISRLSAAFARPVELAKCVSIVTMTTRIGMFAAATFASAAEMSFGIVECFYGDDRYAMDLRVLLGVAASFTAYKEWDFPELLLRICGPGSRDYG